MSKKNFTAIFESFASRATKVAGSSVIFIVAFIAVIVWLSVGSFFNYSDTWRFTFLAGTAIFTFLMVFLIQNAQNRGAIATQIKLNELVAAHDKTSNKIISVEDLSEEELVVINKYYSFLAEKAKKDKSANVSHSIEELNKEVNKA